MKYVLDTNIVSEATRLRPDANCLAWLREHADDCCLTTVTLAEMSFGVERLPDGKKRRDLQRKHRFLCEDFRDRILDFDEVAAHEFGRYVAEFEKNRGAGGLENADVRDLQIAAMARSRNFAVVTRNTGDFPFVNTVNPFV